MRLLASLTAAAAAAATLAAAPPAAPAPVRHSCPDARRAITFYVARAREYESRHDAPITRASASAGSPSCAYVRWSARLWRARARAARRAYQAWFRVTYQKWACIHRGEGSWTDEGLPQMGGLQMDPGFQDTYGPEFVARYGDAGHWPVWAQLLAAERAFHGYHGYPPRYFRPWPNTARACGLL